MSSAPHLRGLIPAPAVPFDESLQLDKEELARHLTVMAELEGVGGFAVNGHAGELNALTLDERLTVIAQARKVTRPDQAVISGIDCPDPGRALVELRQLKLAGADAALVLPPFDSMARRGLARIGTAALDYFERLADADLPLVVFQYPQATGCSYPTQVLRQLARLDHVIAVKNAVWDAELYAEQLAAVASDVSVLAACDAPELLSMVAAGADGILLGASNVGTRSWSEFVHAALSGDFKAAKDIFVAVLMPLLDAQFGLTRVRSATFTALTKEALRQLGVFSSARMRPPEVEPDEGDRAFIAERLRAAGLLPVSGVA